MTNSHATRHPKGVPAGGQFAPGAHSETPVRLEATELTRRPIELGGTVILSRYADEALPAWPKELPSPEVSYSLDDGRVQTHVTVDGETVTYWDTDFGTMDNTDQSFRFNENPWSDMDEDTKEEALDWGRLVHQRIDSNVYALTLEAATRQDAYETIIADAVDRPVPETPEPTPAQSSAQRMDTALSPYPESQDDPHFQVRDLLTDLRHFAHQHDIDLAAALDSSYEVYLQEKADPAFTEGI